MNNAGYGYQSSVEEGVDAEIRAQFEANVFGLFDLTRAVLPHMRQARSGHILNISSVYGLFGGVNRVDYITTKTALIGLTRAVALETARDNITCNAICPGSSPSPAIEQRLQAFMDSEGLARDAAMEKFMAGRQPSGRFVAMESVAAMAAFLCGPGAADITGAALPVDGGWSAS